MTSGRARIALVERPICQPVEQHRCGAREDHAGENKQERAQRWTAISRHEERAQGERQGKDRVRKSDQLEKARRAAVGFEP